MSVMQWRFGVSLGKALMVGTGCGSRTPVPAIDPHINTVEQIVKSNATNAYDVIATLRPQMFTAHGAPTTRGQQPSTAGRQALPVAVYVDNVKVASVAELKGLPKMDVREIRYLSPRAATDRWGQNHAGGVIAVTTFQGVAPDTLEMR
jgi:hypothetical protein